MTRIGHASSVHNDFLLILMARDDEQIRSDVPPPRWRIIQPSSPQLEPLIDFSKPELWNERTQGIVDGFRLKLENFKLHICPTCSRFQSFDRSPRSQECSHCTTQKRKENISHFGVANDMDPGEVCRPLRNISLMEIDS